MKIERMLRGGPVNIHTHWYVRTVLRARVISSWSGMRYHHWSWAATHGVTYDWRGISRGTNSLIARRSPHWGVCLVLGITRGSRWRWGCFGDSFFGGWWLFLWFRLPIGILLLLATFGSTVLEPNLKINRQKYVFKICVQISIAVITDWIKSKKIIINSTLLLATDIRHNSRNGDICWNKEIKKQ